MGLDVKKLYLDRIEQIELDIKKAINIKNWKLKSKLEAEKSVLLDRIAKLDD